MNITFEPKDSRNTDLSKPTIMRNVNKGYLVLTTGAFVHDRDNDKTTFTGIVIVGADTYGFGHWSKYWDAEQFVEHKGVLTIDNTGDHESNI